MGGPPPTARRPVGDQLRAARDGKVQREKSKARGLVDCHPCGRGTRWVAAKATHARGEPRRTPFTVLAETEILFWFSFALLRSANNEVS